MPDVEETTEALALDLPTTAQRMAAIATELEALGQREDLSDDDGRRWRELTSEFERLDIHHFHLIREADLRRIRNAMANGHVEGGSGPDAMDRDPVGEPASIERFRPGREDPFDLRNVRTFDRTPAQVGAELRARALSAVEDMYGMTDSVRQAATRIIETYDNDAGEISRHALVTGHPDYLSAWSQMARWEPSNAQLSPEERRAVIRAMSLVDSAGGYLVPFQLDPTVIITADGSLNEIRRASRVVVATGDKWHGVSAGAVSWSYFAEGAPSTDDSPTFAQPTIDIHTARGFVPISFEALQDEANVTTEVGRLLAFGKDTLEANKFVTGGGTGEPQGILDALVDTDGGVPDYTVNSVTANVLADDDVYGVLGALPARYRARAAWLGHNSIYNRIRGFGATGGSDMWERIGADRPALLVGKPVYESEEMTGIIDALTDNYVLIVGDFDNFVIADRLGMQTELVPHLFQQETAGTGFGMPTGQRGWLAYVRHGAAPVNLAAFRILNVT